MFNTVNFLGLTSKPNFNKPETAGSIAYNSKPQLFRPVETAGSIASSSTSAGSSSGSSSCGSTVAVA